MTFHILSCQWLLRWRWSAPLYRHWGSVQAVWPIGGVEVWLYSFLTIALEGGEGSVSRPGRSPGKTQYRSYRRLGGPQSRSGQVRKISRPTGIRSPDCPAWPTQWLLPSIKICHNKFFFVFSGNWTATKFTVGRIWCVPFECWCSLPAGGRQETSTCTRQ